VKIYCLSGDRKIKIGDFYWFEYHCWESPQSSDAELWYHSHQKVKIIGVDVEYDDMTEQDRYDAAMLNHYKIEFKDGFVGYAGEDELYESTKDFCRPDPPIRNKEIV